MEQEENRVSYWRRLIQARMDLIELQGGDDSVRLERLRLALAETRVGPGRGALVEVMPVDDVPPLPDLAGLWAREADPSDPRDGSTRSRRTSPSPSCSCRPTERRCTAVSSGTTSELIARYHEEPTLALLALPVPPTSSADA